MTLEGTEQLASQRPKKAKPNKATPAPQLTLDRLSSVTAVAADLMPQKPSGFLGTMRNLIGGGSADAVGASGRRRYKKRRKAGDLEAAKAKAEAEEAAARGGGARPEGAARATSKRSAATPRRSSRGSRRSPAGLPRSSR